MLGTLWFVLIGVLIVGYAVFDGFDLGAGTLYPFVAKNEEEKAVIRTAIGPVWDGNEVWLLTAGGALFAAFPNVYATVFSGFYLALMLVLFALIARAAALEFRKADPKWAKFWDVTFFVSSALPSLLFGVAAGNVIRGVPLTTAGEFGGNFFTLLNPFSLVCGVLGLVWFILQGSSWIALKSTGDLALRARSVRKIASVVVVLCIAIASLAAVLFTKDVFSRGVSNPLVWVGAVVAIVGALVAFLGKDEKSDIRSFLASCASMVGLVIMWAANIYPNLLPSLGPGEALSIANSASSNLTLTVMLIIVLIGLPLVITYIFLIYRAFAGRISADQIEEEY